MGCWIRWFSRGRSSAPQHIFLPFEPSCSMIPNRCSPCHQLLVCNSNICCSCSHIWHIWLPCIPWCTHPWSLFRSFHLRRICLHESSHICIFRLVEYYNHFYIIQLPRSWLRICIHMEYTLVVVQVCCTSCILGPLTFSLQLCRTSILSQAPWHHLVQICR